MAVTPMMKQYLEIKENYKDCILFFRLGDFYEMFYEDALTASREMEVTLTGKSCGEKEKAPMCGVPYHAADTYIARLVEKGYKVAICEQMEDPSTTKGLVKRDVIRIITPGTVLSPTMLSESENNYLASVYMAPQGAGLAYCDISTGEICATQITGQDIHERLLNELVRIKAKEILLNPQAQQYDICDSIRIHLDTYSSLLAESIYDEAAAEKAVLAQFKTGSLTGLGLSGAPETVLALSALLSYLFETQKQDLAHLNRVAVYDTGRQMSLDKATIKNLELTETLFEKKVQGSLLGVLDKTHTAMGSRKMRQWLREPLNTLTDIQRRLDAVEALADNILTRNQLREALKKIYDLERLSGRIACGNANGKDLAALKNSIYMLPEIKAGLADLEEDALLTDMNNRIDSLEEIYSKIDEAIVEEPPFSVREGGLIREGYSQELDQLKASIRDGQQWIASLEQSERARTGIKNLKVGYNKVFGYYLEVTKSYFDLIPDNYIRKQTLANCERFITPELKEVESVVLNAEAKINQMEYELFSQLRSDIQARIPQIQQTSGAIAELDVLVSFAEVSSRLGYVKPEINDGREILIERGRHPVIEQMIRDGMFVSNDVYLNETDSSMLLITGPNMAGKSTYMRQTALIVLMAQAGCFVPADRARIGLVDRIYTRIGASDNLSQGQSTFFVEMSELAYILNTATEKSLVILDEIGRGTSTYDGLSIAWAVVEHLCCRQRRIRTLFATHYHELTALEDSIPGVKNLNVDVSDENGNVVFLHRIVEGSASRSYGIHVARLAGVPEELLTAAEENLGTLEKSGAQVHLRAAESQGQSAPVAGLSEDGASRVAGEKRGGTVRTVSGAGEAPQQLSLWDFAASPVIQRIRSLNLMEITPSKAFEILEELQKETDKL